MRFLADTMLGRLARWLRLLGYDTAYPGQESDPRLARMAAEENRILLTRDRELFSRKGFRKLLIHSNLVSEQLAQMRDDLGLTFGRRTFSICLVCNQPLEKVDKNQVREQVPPYVLQTQRIFSQCPQCRRVYWAGTHIDHIHSHMEKWGWVPEDIEGDENEPR